MSYGTRKAIEFARAIVFETRLLHLDEPTASLSPFEMEDLRDRLSTGRRHRPMTLLGVTHHLEFLAQIADAVTVLDLGHVTASGSPTEIQANPKVVSAYVGEGT